LRSDEEVVLVAYPAVFGAALFPDRDAITVLSFLFLGGRRQ